jgi:hypothetical protein
MWIKHIKLHKGEVKSLFYINDAYVIVFTKDNEIYAINKTELRDLNNLGENPPNFVIEGTNIKLLDLESCLLIAFKDKESKNCFQFL